MKLPEQAQSAAMLNLDFLPLEWLENTSLLFQRHHTHSSSQRRVRGRYGDVLYPGRGAHLTGMEREPSGTDHKCAWWPSKTHTCRVTERTGVREHFREGTRVPETGSYLDRG